MRNLMSLYTFNAPIRLSDYDGHKNISLLQESIGRVPYSFDHHRNIVDSGGDIFGNGSEIATRNHRFDVITSLSSNGVEENNMFSSFLNSPESAYALDGINPQAVNKEKTFHFLTEEYRTSSSELGDGDAFSGAKVKMMITIGRKPSMSREDFINYYESRHAVLSAQHLRATAGYYRNYPVPGTGAPDGIDVITEMWFRDRAKFDELAAAMTVPEIAAIFAKDEEYLFDRSTINMFLVQEYVTTLDSDK